MKLVLIFVLLAFEGAAHAAASTGAALLTRWGRSVTPSSAWPEYPRPQLVRSTWQSLNGPWQYAVTPAPVKSAKTVAGRPPAPLAPARFDGTILVPFPLGSALSGAPRTVSDGEHLWYQRTFSLAPDETGEKILLHFEAIDAPAEILLNGNTIGVSRDGSQRFTLDVTRAMRRGVNTLSVDVTAPRDGVHGIWQSVWLESLPSAYVEKLSLTPDADHGAVAIEARIAGDSTGLTAYAVVSGSSAAPTGDAAAEGAVSGKTTLRIKQPHLWSPEDPYLYQVDVAVMRSGQIIDQVHSYFGLRKVETRADAQGHMRIRVNGAELFNLAVREAGLWPDGFETAPTDAALRFDVEAAKSMGFNTIYKRGPPAPDRWYFDCDKLGILVWQDIGHASEIAQRADHPSIIAWLVPADAGSAAAGAATGALRGAIQQTDPARLLGAAPGLIGGAAVVDRSAETQGYAARAAQLKTDAGSGLSGAVTAQLADGGGADGLLSADRATAHTPMNQIGSSNRNVVPQAPHHYETLRDVH